MATVNEANSTGTSENGRLPPLESGDRLTRAEFERRYDAMPGLKKAELIDGVVYVASPVSLDNHGEPHGDLMTVLPPLQSGDRLTRDEFERRYGAMPGLKKAELIDGVVYMPSPVSLENHGEPHGQVMTILGTFYFATPGVRMGDNSTLRLAPKSEPQPDGCLLIRPELGGQARIDADGYIAGGPELVAEVAASSASYDLHDKLDAYRQSGVKEYVVWRVYDRAIDWFVLREDRYEALALSLDGLYRSEVFPGLWLDPAALLRGDLAGVLQALQQGLASPEHAAFVSELEGRKLSRRIQEI